METGKVIEAAIAYFENDIRRISHLLKVYGFAKAIGEKEQLDLFTMECLETAAVLHDIGIKISEEKYQSSAGKYQELDRKSTRLNSSHTLASRMPSSA